MKKIILIIAIALKVCNLYAQSNSYPSSSTSPNSQENPKVDVQKKADERIYQVKDRTSTSIINKPALRLENAVDKAIDKTLDHIGSDIRNAFKKKKVNQDSIDQFAKNSKSPVTATVKVEPNPNKPKENSNDELEEITTINESSTNTFKRGTQLIFQDDFTKDAIGDFPAQWDTKQGGEVIQIKNREGKWLKINNKDNIFPELKKSLPENFTIEFDAIIPNKDNDFEVKFSDGVQYGGYIYFSFNSRVTPEVKQYISYQAIDGMSSLNKSEIEEKGTAIANKATHFAFEVNGKRIRWYINNVKKIDLPTAFLANYRKNFSIEPTRGAGSNFESTVYLSNVIIAETTSDARSNILKELLEKGSFSTNAILFETNSFTIKPSSNETLASIAQALNEDKTLKINIIGHTDNVGNANKNTTLSQNRANSVKTELVNKYGIDSNRFSSEGKGSTQPIADNNTEQGKASNRRVEFIVVKNK
jgi:OmpA-OmpF porin, OOP family